MPQIDPTEPLHAWIYDHSTSKTALGQYMTVATEPLSEGIINTIVINILTPAHQAHCI